ncbi:MAG: hypothetical protein ABL901_05530 [Hyphomicrobiaceae bacterium]
MNRMPARYLNGFVEILGRSRIPCKISGITAIGASLELLERTHLLPTIGLRIGDSHRVLDCLVTKVDRSKVIVTFKQADGIEGAAIMRAIRIAQDALLQ